MTETPAGPRTRRRRFGPKSARRLYVKAVFTGYKRGQHTAPLNPNGVFRKIIRFMTCVCGLYVKAVFTGYKRGHRNRHENTSLLKVDGVNDKGDAKFYLGKRAIGVYEGHNKITRGGGPKTRVRAIGAVRAKFRHNSKPTAMGKLFLYGSIIVLVLFVDVAVASPIEISQTFLINALRFCTFAMVVGFILWSWYLRKKVHDIRKDIEQMLHQSDARDRKRIRVIPEAKKTQYQAVVKHPIVLWGQRSPHLYLAVEVEDMNIEELTIEEDKFKIKGWKGHDKYEADLQFFGKLNGTELRKIATGRRVEFVIHKEKEEWWPRLLKEKIKVAWIKVDFDKWKDEDEEKDDDGGGAPFGGMDFSSFGMPSEGKGSVPRPFPRNNHQVLA